MTETPKTIEFPKPGWQLHKERPAVQLIVEAVRVAEKLVLPASLINLAHRPNKLNWAAFKMDSGLLAEVGGYLTAGPALMSGNPEAMAGSLTALLLGKAQAIEGGAMARSKSGKTGVEHDPAVLQWPTLAITEGFKTILPALVTGRELRDRLGLYRLTQEALKYAADLPALGMIAYGVISQDQVALGAGVTMYGASRLLERTVEFAEDHPDILTKRGKLLATVGVAAGTAGLKIARRVSAKGVAQTEAVIKGGVEETKRMVGKVKETGKRFREWDARVTDKYVYKTLEEGDRAAREIRTALQDMSDRAVIGMVDSVQKAAKPVTDAVVSAQQAKTEAGERIETVKADALGRLVALYDQGVAKWGELRQQIGEKIAKLKK